MVSATTEAVESSIGRVECAALMIVAPPDIPPVVVDVTFGAAWCGCRIPKYAALTVALVVLLHVSWFKNKR
jgi:hypothetical protein